MLNASESKETESVLDFVHFDYRIFPCSVTLVWRAQKGISGFNAKNIAKFNLNFPCL
jgi:hypothetical protein